MLIYTPSMLLHFDGTVSDSSLNHATFTIVSGATTSGAAAKFGSAGLSCPSTFGNHDYITTPIAANSPIDLNSTTNDWTVEFWGQQLETGSGYSAFFSLCSGNGTLSTTWSQTEFGWTDEGNWTVKWGPANGTSLQVTGAFAFSAATQFYAIALVRHNGVITVYINGVGQTTNTLTCTPGLTWNSTVFAVGNSSPGSSGGGYPTYMDEFRVTNAALYTANYTPSTTAFTAGLSPSASNNGDITDPYAWQDASGSLPPTEFSNVPYNVNYPLNGDGRYWWEGNATSTTGGTIGFVGSLAYLINTGSLQWSITQPSSDSSYPVLSVSTDGINYTFTSLGSSLTAQAPINESGQVLANLTSASVFYVAVLSSGGTVTTGATPWQVALAITRNANEKIAWDYPNPMDPVSYNGLAIDNTVPTATLSSLAYRVLVRLGFANQATNPPPGMLPLVYDFLTSAQTFLYRRYLQLHTKRLFRWKVNPGQRFYSLRDTDENATEGVMMDYARTIEWAGIQDSRNVWYPLIQGIPPQLNTMITKPWRPARYELKGAIEIYPAPDQTYWMWMKGHFGLMPFTLGTQSTTIDCELVFLHALANAKAHYGQSDANNIESQANAYRAELIAASHQTAHYLPGTIAVPPAVRPTLIAYDGGGQGGA